MYSYNFENEKVIYENQNAFIEVNDKTYNKCILITDKNILIFNNANKHNALNTRGMYMPPDYLLELSISLEKLKYNIEDGDTYITYNNDNIIIFNIDLEKIKG